MQLLLPPPVSQKFLPTEVAQDFLPVPTRYFDLIGTGLVQAPPKRTFRDNVLHAFEPLNEKTKKLVERLPLARNDYLYISLVGDGNEFLLQPYAMLDGKKVSASINARDKWFSRIPERKKSHGDAWIVAATDFSALIINAIWPESQLQFDEDSGAKAYYYFLLTRFFAQSVSAQEKAIFKMKGALPELHPGYTDHPTLPLAPYQTMATHASIGRSHALFMEPGTGKTAVCIRRICYEADTIKRAEGRMYRCLVICPKSIRRNWEDEIIKFSTVPGKCGVVRGDVIGRMKCFMDITREDQDAYFSVAIASYEGVVRTLPMLLAAKWDWDLIIVDESHNIKWQATKRWQGIAELRNKSHNRMVLTGTPMPRTVDDIYTQLEFLDHGLSGFTSQRAFRNFYSVYEREYQHDRLVGYVNLPFLQERLARLAFVITKKEALPNLPDKTYSTREAVLTRDQAKVYKTLATKIYAEAEELLANSKSQTGMTVQNILVKLLRLAQVTCGFVKYDDQYAMDGETLLRRGDVEYFEPNSKMQVLMEEIQNLSDQSKAIVWCPFVPAIEYITKELTKAGIGHVVFYGGTNDHDREEAIQKFNNDPSIKIFLGNPSAGGVGLNLRGYNPDWEGTDKDHGMNCDTVIYFGNTWNMAHRTQSEDRAHRRGTRVPVQIIDILVPGSIDDTIRERIHMKKSNADAIQDLRAILSRLSNMEPIQGDD